MIFLRINKARFSELINDNKDSLYRVAKGILKIEEDAEDAIQNSIIKAYEKLYTLRKEEYFKTWIIRILINECNNIIRKNKKIIKIDDTVIYSIKYEDKYDEIDLRESVRNLEKDLREVTILFYYEDMSQRDIAKILKIKEGTVKSRLFRARTKLYESIKEES